ncbi:MAG: polysaccharide deacetylase family protein [Alphaproteobacteria bacterium]
MTTTGDGPKTTQTPETSGKDAEKQAEQRPIFILYGFMVLLVLLSLIGFRLSTTHFLNPQTIHLAHSGGEHIRTSALKGSSDTNLEAEDAQGADKTAKARPACPADAFGPGRAIPLDSTGGPKFGLIQYRDTIPLKEGEVVFTFDDGPHPKRTPKILDILDKHCIKAVFFMIGDMAHEHPEIVREVARRGHVIGTHTWSHPLRLTRYSSARAQAEIEHGFTAINQALGKPSAPFFRFPGLIHSKKLLTYLAKRNISVWSVDVVAGDTERRSRHHLAATLKKRLAKRGQGILLFHDVKQVTINNLEKIIKDLKDDGYSPAYIKPTQSYSLPEQIAQLPTIKHLAIKKKHAAMHRRKRHRHRRRHHRRRRSRR